MNVTYAMLAEGKDEREMRSLERMLAPPLGSAPVDPAAHAQAQQALVEAFRIADEQAAG